MNTRTVLVDVLDAQGRVLLRERVALAEGRSTITVGRSVTADVTLDDDYVAELHATLDIAPNGQILANDLGTLNGIIVAGARRRGAQALLLPDGRLQLGRTSLRVRTDGASTGPEKRDATEPMMPERPWVLVAGVAALIGAGQLIHSSWIGAPRDLLGSIVASASTIAMVAAAWIAVWGLLSRVMVGEWRWLRHACILLAAAACVAVADGILDFGWFSLSLSPWSSQRVWTGAIVAGGALYLHLVNASHLAGRRACLIACIVPVVIGGGSLWLSERQAWRDVNQIGTRLRIYPPALRLRTAGPLDDYFKIAGDLRDAADKKRKAAIAEDVKDGIEY